MPHNVRPDRFTEYNLEPSQCGEWIIENAAALQSSVIVCYGWMSSRPPVRDAYHTQTVLDQIERIRQLLNILEAHVEPPAAEAAPVEDYGADLIYTLPGVVGFHAFDALNDDQGPDSPTGWGSTEVEAVEDLRDQLGEAV